MTRQHTGHFKELLALMVPLAATYIELRTLDAYHQVESEFLQFFVLAFAVGLTLLLWMFSRSMSVGRVQGGVIAANRLLGLAIWGFFVGLSGVSPSQWWMVHLPAQRALLLVAATLLALLVTKAGLWVRARYAVLAAVMLLVLSQFALARLTSQPFSWPQGEAGRQGTPPDALIFVLFDELNARNAGPMAQELQAMGMKTQLKELMPVADSTAKVIPQMFSGLRFDNPKPCSTTAMCDAGHAFDFSKTSASRNDIDVVGFFHPYCAIQGLRSCAKVDMHYSMASMSWRWRCALARRTGGALDEKCIPLGNATWVEMQDAAVDALWRAPIWQRGGMLYAHLPLPHPPGSRSPGTLSEHYRDNVQRSQELLLQMVKRLRVNGFKRIELIVFADHPLRQQMWCRTPVYHFYNCQPDPGLEDSRVPLLVATEGVDTVRLDGIDRNDQIFKLAPQSSQR